MAKKPDNEKRITERLTLYREDFDIDSLNSSNDKAMLMTLIRCEIILENVQDEITNITSSGSDFLEEADRLKKLFDLQRDMMAQITKAQQTLSIDRKTRKNEQTNSVAEYVRELKTEAPRFLEKRFIRIYCPDCKVMVGRYAPVHEHTAFIVSTECSQCAKAVRAHREARDIWFDIRDADWRREYSAEIVQPKIRNGFNTSVLDDGTEDELYITGQSVEKSEPALIEDMTLDIPAIPSIEPDTIIGGTYGTETEAG